MSRAIGDMQARPLASVFRDKDTADGGKAGHITTNPADVDAVVKRAWKKIYNGNVADAVGTVANLLENIATFCIDASR